MAEISKLSGVAIADVAKVDAVLKANIANINDLTIPADGLLLDTYTGAAAAYSVRRLLTAYTGSCMRVREDSGDTETDIGFDSNGDLDTAAIATHCGTANGYVTKWYGQESSGGTGSGNDAAQTTSGSQPQIYNGTAVITLNGKPVLDLSSRRLTASNPSGISTVSMVANRPTSGSGNVRLLESRDGTSTRQAVIGHSGTTFFVMYQASTSASAVGPNLYEIATSAGQYHYFSASNTAAFCNGQTPTTTSGSTFTFGSTLNLLSINGRTSGQSISPDFEAQEIVLWSTDHDADRSGIEGNINTYFSIY